MIRKVLIASMIFLLPIMSVVTAQNLDGNAYTPGVDADIDMYFCTWMDSNPRHTHGSLIERDILTKGDPMNPPRRGAVLKYINGFCHASLFAGNSTQPTTLKGEQEVFYILSGNGSITAGSKTVDLYKGMAILMPESLEFTMTNSGDDTMTMYLIKEPTPPGFRPNTEMVYKDENVQPIEGTTGHWAHIVKSLFKTNDGLGALESVITVSLDPMTIGHPHSHAEGVEEAWTAIEGTSVAFIGKQIRMQPPGTGYMIPPDGVTPHSNINQSKTEPIKLLYFARYADHAVRP